MMEGEDVESFLTIFERVMRAHEVPENQWSLALVSQLAGKAQQAYTAVDDVPELMELVSAPEEKCLVVTSAQTQRQYTEEEREKKLNESSKVI